MMFWTGQFSAQPDVTYWIYSDGDAISPGPVPEEVRTLHEASWTARTRGAQVDARIALYKLLLAGLPDAPDHERAQLTITAVRHLDAIRTQARADAKSGA